MFFSPAKTLRTGAALAALLFASGTTMVGAQSSQTQLTVTNPTSQSWWIAQSTNTLAWQTPSSGAGITQFSVFLANSDPNILAGYNTSPLALISIQPTYEYSKSVNPGQVKPGTGYTIRLTDPLNSTNIYASSETFEIKAVGSPYPPQGAAGGTGSSSASATSSASSGSNSASSASSAAASATSRSAANPRAVNPLFHGAAAAGYLFNLFVDNDKRSYLPFKK